MLFAVFRDSKKLAIVVAFKQMNYVREGGKPLNKKTVKDCRNCKGEETSRVTWKKLEDTI